ncbi:MAG: leucyl aminopeptidase [Acidobacteria bacterium]|nr:MAG: leucyl aminopeptidase [Acidobacteriota bacterium]
MPRMKLPIRFEVASGRPAEAGADALVLFRTAGGPWPATGAPAADRVVRSELERRGFEAGPAKVERVDVELGGARRPVVVVGMGREADGDAARVRRAAAAAARAVSALGVRSCALSVPPAPRSVGGLDERLRLAAEGFGLGLYRFDKYRTSSRERGRLQKAVFCTGSLRPAFREALRRASAVTAGVFLARDLVNEPAGVMTPREFVRRARAESRRAGIRMRVLGPSEIARQRMTALAAVAAGSDEPPRVAHLVLPARRRRPAARLAFVGKGVTFDAGGYNIKTGSHISDMKMDMAGAAAVLGAMSALAAVGCDAEIHGFVGLVENLVSGRAYKPGDVLRTRRGLTVEVSNTDAEGRLVLADLLDWVRTTVEADLTVDVATLTGACVIALGTGTAGIMGNDRRAVDRVLDAAKRAGERCWPLPLFAEDRDQLKSHIADLKNTGPRWGGALTAGLFLKEFAGDRPWVHMDIAGPAFSDKDDPLTGRGGTGAAVATLVRLAERT